MVRASTRDTEKTGRRQKGRLINLGDDKLYFVADDTSYAKEIDGILNRKRLAPFRIKKEELICLTEEELEALLNDSTSLRPARK
jgi:hypothetical protein